MAVPVFFLKAPSLGHKPSVPAMGQDLGFSRHLGSREGSLCQGG